MGPGDVLAMLILFGSITAIITLRGPLGRAIADRIAGRAHPHDPDLDRLAEMSDRVLGELDDVRHRLVELEERQEFTERVLAQQRERPGLPAREG